jgi:hypothetical protein
MIPLTIEQVMPYEGVMFFFSDRIIREQPYYRSSLNPYGLSYIYAASFVS